ncbi:MAG: Imm30 family immunity protein, partial [Cyanobacteria bacterium P01_A01_bin.68]
KIQLSKSDTIELIMILDDENPHQEVLWGLLHFIEDSIKSEILIKTLFECTQKLLIKAPEWTQLFYIRLLNNQESLSILKVMLLDEEISNSNIIIEIIREIYLKELSPLSDYANFVINH